jgi:hypothetical protein
MKEAKNPEESKQIQDEAVSKMEGGTYEPRTD